MILINSLKVIGFKDKLSWLIFKEKWQCDRVLTLRFDNLLLNACYMYFYKMDIGIHIIDYFYDLHKSSNRKLCSFFYYLDNVAHLQEKSSLLLYV